MRTCKTFWQKTLIAACLAAMLPLSLQAAPQPGEQSGHQGGGMSPPPILGVVHGEGPRAMHEPMLPQPPFLRGVELTEAQRDRLFMIVHEQMPEVRKKSRAIRVAQDKLQALAQSSQYDEANARALAETAAKEMKELALLRARADQTIYAMLTPAQRKQVDEMKRHPESMAEPAMQGRRAGIPSEPR
ncbi:MAG: motif family protein [Proteobacteria bacterium]|nr:motif family protein [Pseudomonadota bacterium]